MDTNMKEELRDRMAVVNRRADSPYLLEALSRVYPESPERDAAYRKIYGLYSEAAKLDADLREITEDLLSLKGKELRDLRFLMTEILSDVALCFQHQRSTTLNLKKLLNSGRHLFSYFKTF